MAIATDKGNAKNISGSPTGLSSAEAAKRLKENGKNELENKKKSGIISQFFSQMKDFSIIVLLFAAGLSFAVSVFEGERNYTDMTVILSIVVLNAVIGVFQERKAEKALEALKCMAAPEARVIRDKKEVCLPSASLVVGDVIVLSAGDAVPADAVLIKSNSLRTDESALTGESVPCDKDADFVCREDTPLSERKNMVFASTFAVFGRAVARVTATGMNTEIGKIAAMLGEKQELTPLQKRLQTLSKLLGIGALGCCAAVFILGIIRKNDIPSSFLLAVSLAVAAIPEGLPAIVTVVLSRGVGILSKRGAIVKRLSCCETLGNATVICSDKTGTLTENRMSAASLWVPGGTLLSPLAAVGRELLFKAALCTDCTVKKRHGKAVVSGEPTEAGIVRAAIDAGFSPRDSGVIYSRINEIPFDSDRKRMTTVHRDGNSYLWVMKGAPQVVLNRCTKISSGGNIHSITDAERRSVIRYNDRMASQALRVLAVAVGTGASLPKDFETNLVFLGLIGLQDPPRADAVESVKICKKAGITPVMITGDQAGTAEVIARNLGISDGSTLPVDGVTLDSMDDETLKREISGIRVFARVSPTHKMRIVKAFKDRGETVAMTGDGVNDAPALQAADIGCAMGKSGTEVAKSAADLVLTDDRFSTIVDAVETGRGLFDNIRKAVRFLISCNIGEILLVFMSSLMGFPAPLLPVQLLWLNLVTDSLPAMALGAEKPDRDIMARAPAKKGEGILSRADAFDIGIEGFLFGAISLLAFVCGFHTGSLESGRTMAFCTLSLSEVFHAFNVRTQRSVFSVSPFENISLFISTLLCIGLQLGVVFIAPASKIFNTCLLTGNQWAIVGALCIVPLVVTECEKIIQNRGNEKIQKGKSSVKIKKYKGSPKRKIKSDEPTTGGTLNL